MTESQLPSVHDDKFCSAKKRQGSGRCRQPAGWGTNHVGSGRCKLHGGATPIKSGIYSTIAHERLRALIAQHEANPDPLNILHELAAARALFQDYVERYNEWRDALIAWHETQKPDYKATTDDGVQRAAAPRPTQILDIGDAYRIVSEVTKIAKRIEDIRAQNAISRKDFVRVMQEMARVVEAVVERRVSDVATRDQLKAEIKDRWLEIRLA